MPGKALILVGGFGTRLRPLTFTKPKPLVEFINKPILMHQVEALVAVGVDKIVLAVNYRPDDMAGPLKEMEEKFGIEVVCSLEEEPLGTAGPLKLAAKHLVDADEEPFFVFNSDVTCSYPLKDLLSFHKAHGKEGTIIVTPVADPSKYGVVVHDSADGRIQRFVEKPKEFVGKHINAGLYLFNPSILDRIPLRPTSIEREIFPAMVSDEQLHCMPLDGFWMDIGQPKDYLSGQCLFLKHLNESKAADMVDPPELASGSNIRGNVVIDPTAEIGEDCIVGPDVVIGPGAKIGRGVRLERCTILGGANVGDFSFVFSSIVGWNAKIGKWNRVDEHSVIGEAVTFKDGLCCNGGIVLPHKGIGASIYEPGTIKM